MRRRRPVQRDMDRVVRTFRNRSDHLVNRLADGRIDLEEWVALFLLLLLGQHTKATVLGRQRAGDLTPEEQADRDFAQTVVDEERHYVDGFAADIRDGRYDDAEGKLRPGPVKSRARTYGEKLTGTANETFAMASSEDEQFYWELGREVEEHCRDCPRLAAGSPYTFEELPTLPKQGQTECHSNCDCHLRRKSDNLTGFKATASENAKPNRKPD